MSSISQVSDALRRVLTTRAKEREREMGFVERSTAQLDGPTFVQTTVFGWLETPEASAPELLSRFNGVYVQDGTIISLPAALHDEWRGCGGSTPEAGQSSMQVQVRLDLAQGGMQGPWLQEGRAAERSGAAHEAPLPQGCLYNVDAGYFTLAQMRAHGKAG